MEHIESTDKSDGRGCIGCSLEEGKTCEGCIHIDDIVNKAKDAISKATPK